MLWSKPRGTRENDPETVRRRVSFCHVLGPFWVVTGRRAAHWQDQGCLSDNANIHEFWGVGQEHARMREVLDNSASLQP